MSAVKHFKLRPFLLSNFMDSTLNKAAIPADRFYASITQKTPPRNEAIAPHDTPTHNRLSSTVPQTSTNVFIERPFVEAAREMKGNFWGPVSVQDFFDKFLNVEVDPIPEIDFEAVKDVANQKLETAMYDPLVNLPFIYF